MAESSAIRRMLPVVGVWLAALIVFRAAPVQQLHDSKYTMLVAENLLRHRDLDLARYHLPADDYRLRQVGPHRYDYYPVGSAVLSAPFVALMHARGLSAVRADGSYDERGEIAIDKRLAAILMATFAALAFATSRLLLPELWSLAIAAAAAFGTQVFSTASRSVWSDTWGILLIGAGVFLLLDAASRKVPTRAALLGAALSLAYVVRPTNAAAAAGAGALLLLTEHRAVVPFAATTALVVGLFLSLSWSMYGQPLPPYFTDQHIVFQTPGTNLAGHFFSPSRGLLVYVPALLAVGWGLVRYRRTLRFRPLLGLAVFVTMVHFVVLAGFWDWWGGHSYGPRLCTSLVPWFVVLAILAADAARGALAARGPRASDRAFGAVTAILCAISVAMNSVGALSWEADRWNVTPDNIDVDTARLWSWQRPQFLSPFVPAPQSRPR
jgi:hypothetical protein